MSEWRTIIFCGIWTEIFIAVESRGLTCRPTQPSSQLSLGIILHFWPFFAGFELESFCCRVEKAKVDRERYCTQANVNKVKGWGSVTGLTRHDVTIYFVPWHNKWSAKAKVITITKLMLKCDTFLKIPCEKAKHNHHHSLGIILHFWPFFAAFELKYFQLIIA